MMKSYYNFSQNVTTGTTFVTAGATIGAGVYSTIGGVGLVGGFGGIGLGMTPLIGVGAVAGAATYGAFRAINQGDYIAWGAVGLGAVSGIGISSVVGGMGVGFAGTAVGIGMGTLGVFGGIFGLGLYGIAQLIDDTGSGETAFQAFERMEERILDQDFYTEALLELIPEFKDEQLKQQFNNLELEDELIELKKQIKSPQNLPSQKDQEKPNIENNSIVISSNSPGLIWKETQSLVGHKNSIHAVAFSPDSQTLISASDDKNVHIWNINTGNRKYTWFLPDEVYSVAISPDSKVVATGTSNGKITLWDFSTRQMNRILLDHNIPEKNMGIIPALIFSGDSQKLISGSSDKTVRIWNIKTGQYQRILNGHTDAVWSVAISSNSQFIASGSADQTIRIWDIKSYEHPRILTGHSNWVTSVLFSQDDQILISASADHTIKLWDWKNHQLIQTLTGHSAAIFSIALSPNGEILASGSVDKTVKLWNVKTGELLQTLSGCSPVVFSPDGKLLVSGGQRGFLQLWNQQLSSRKLNQYQLKKDWWEVLGVHSQATPNQVKQAYYQLAKLYHPDHNIKSEAIAIMQIINYAYETFLNEWSQRVRSQ
jgi:WD40 repeat protein